MVYTTHIHDGGDDALQLMFIPYGKGKSADAGGFGILDADVLWLGAAV
jgi:hypothetical protein